MNQNIISTHEPNLDSQTNTSRSSNTASNSSFEKTSLRSPINSLISRPSNQDPVTEGWERDTIVEKLSADHLKSSNSQYLPDQSVIYSRNHNHPNLALKKAITKPLALKYLTNSESQDIDSSHQNLEFSESLKDIDLSKNIEILSKTQLSPRNSVPRKPKGILLADTKKYTKTAALSRSAYTTKAVAAFKPISATSSRKYSAKKETRGRPENRTVVLLNRDFKVNPKPSLTSSFTSIKNSRKSNKFSNYSRNRKSLGEPIKLKKKGPTRMKSDIVTSKSNSKLIGKLRHSSSTTLELQISRKSESLRQDTEKPKEPSCDSISSPEVSPSDQMPAALASFQPQHETSNDEYNISLRAHSITTRPGEVINTEMTFDYLELSQDISPGTLETLKSNNKEEHINYETAKEIESLLSKNLEAHLSIQTTLENTEKRVASPKNQTPVITEKIAENPPAARVMITEPSIKSEKYGVTIDKNHANYVLMYNMLTGIRVSVSRCIAKSKRNIEPRDYKAAHKYSFDLVGDEQVPKRGCYDFKFKDYAPIAFHNIRCAFNLSGTDYLVALTDRYILSEVGSSGKSGSFFYYSQDLRFIIKTISKTEHKFMRVFLKDYCEHIRNNPDTLLSRIYGLHRIKQPHGKKIHFIVMNNLFPPPRIIHEQFDLKGSYQGRRANKEQLDKNSVVCLKDLDWLDMQRKLHLGPDAFHRFAVQLASDVGLLMQVNIMDYSLLVGIHDLSRGNSFDKTDIGILKRQTLSLFDPTITQLPQHQSPMSRVNTIRNKVVRTDPIALPITHIPLKRSGTNKNKITTVTRAQASSSTPDNYENEKLETATVLNKASKNTISENILQTKAKISVKLENTNLDLNKATIANEEYDISEYQLESPQHSASECSTEEDGIRAADESGSQMEYVYYMGIIDILTPYNKRKRAEHLLKSVWYKSSQSMSVVNPKKYANRFLKFVYSQIETGEGRTALDDAMVNDILENFRTNSSEVKPRGLARF